jgi:hypothetical protein
MTTRPDDLYEFRRDLRNLGERALGLQRHPEGSPARAAALCDLLIDFGAFPAQARALDLDEGRIDELRSMFDNARSHLRAALPEVRARACFEALCFGDELAEDVGKL